MEVSNIEEIIVSWISLFILYLKLLFDLFVNFEILGRIYFPEKSIGSMPLIRLFFTLFPYIYSLTLS
ncbi:hypothetical protein MADA3029_900078 [Vibrio nigripulchritudo MADA3029]|nr:hypothetical protein VIBNIMADA3020_1040041 [Vibrio nigripulchritudo MADA3020]CCN51769.1 hypothetical protein VIBNIMADA3021_1160077 [Vibrio nigripulchritudo MADA3021]CCN61933.1 hypothetical protein MADA3029_900078 [Vibrio nigripulchritudo MADA3029]